MICMYVHTYLNLFIKKLTLFIVCVCIRDHVCTCGDKRPMPGSQFFPSTVWVLGIRFRSSGLVGKAFSHKPRPGPEPAFLALCAGLQLHSQSDRSKAVLSRVPQETLAPASRGFLCLPLLGPHLISPLIVSFPPGSL